MVKLNFVHLCDTAFMGGEDKGRKANIIGIFENINARNFPAIHPKFSVITEIQGDAGKYKQSIVVVNKETGQEISRIDGESEIKVLNGKAIFIGDFLMIAFPTFGKYVINILINDNNIGNIEFNVRQI